MLRSGDASRLDADPPSPTLLTTSAADLLADLRQGRDEVFRECFGPTTLVAPYDNEDELLAVAEAIDGQLTASIIGTDDDPVVAPLRDALALKAGRVLWNGWPTGVSVTYAQQHGGPYPATTAPTTTSVGTEAIARFLRPVAYQGFPQHLLPAALRDDTDAAAPARRAARPPVQTTRLISAVDSHTEGMPTRVVTGGVGVLPGASMAERRLWFLENSDDLRTLLMYEPRGHASMSGAILQPPTRPDADYGVLFIEVSGLLPMCGHGTMGVATVLVETGMVPVTEPVTTIRLEVPAGLVVAEVAVCDGHATSVTLRMVPSFSLALDQHVQVPGFGSVGYDIAYGGNFYAIVELASLGLPFDRREKGRLLDAGLAIMAAINEQNRPAHPERPDISGCHHVYLAAPGSTAQHSRHAMAIHPGWFDRSPCGTGTCARMAQLHARGELPLDSEFVNESFIGSIFRGRLLETTTVARAAGGAAAGHRTGLGDRHRAVHARSRRPVPRRLPAVTRTADGRCRGRRRGRGGCRVRVLHGPGRPVGARGGAGSHRERHQQRLRGQPAGLGQGGRSRARPRPLLPRPYGATTWPSTGGSGSSRPRAAWSSWRASGARWR